MEKSSKIENSNYTSSAAKVRDLCYIALCVALMAICSWISVPTVVPFTLQTLGVFLCFGLLGGKRGTLAVLIYILVGAVGIPVFSGFSGGLGIIFGNTGGYIVGFLAAALIMWLFEKIFGNRPVIYAVSMIAGLAVCYAFGTAWFIVLYTRSTGAVQLLTVLGWCVFPFIIPDLLKIAVAFYLSMRLKPFIK